MEYMLMCKDSIVLRFCIDRVERVVNLARLVQMEVSSVDVCDDGLLPLNLTASDKGLRSWLLERKIPNNRAYVNSLLDAISDTENPFRYLDITYGLSLNDTYWVKPSYKDIHWADINLYDNPFSELVANIAFTGEQSHIKGIVTTPEFTTNGMLKKCWHRERDTIYLYKGATPRFANGGLEALTEVYASQIAEAMRLPHVPYKMTTYHNQQVCACPIFTSESTSYMPISGIIPPNLTRDELMLYDKQFDIGALYGMQSFSTMMVFDALIHNTDRHLNNFGLLVDSESNTILGPAPLFDHGNSLFYNLTDEEFYAATDITNPSPQDTGHSFWGISFDTQAKLYLHDSHKNMLTKLLDFKFRRIPSELMNDAKLDALGKYIQHRAKYFLTLLQEKYINFAQ